MPPANASLDQAESLIEDSYTYGALNRLSTVSESSLNIAGGGSWIPQFAQGNSFDRYGNRTINAGQTWGAGINNKQFTVTESNNRLGVPSGQGGTMTYDAAGNLTADTYSGAGVTRVYDADNRMVSETQAGGYVAGVYSYSADAHRVRRTVGGTTTWQVYGMDGELLAEYAVSGAAASPQKEYGYRNGQLLVTTEPNAGNNTVQWLVGDQLGTPRMVADKTGLLVGVKRHDYLPFGEELYAGTGSRTLASGYSGDNVRQKFTSKERDSETGLDYFEARYYATTQGRFTSVDSLLVDQKRLGNPQLLNAFGYVGNNPLRYIDPDGKDPQDPVVVQRKTYSVHGKTGAEAWENANRNNPNKGGKRGETEWNIQNDSGRTTYTAAKRVKGGVERSVTVTGVTVSAAIIVTLPVWEERDKASSEDQKAWDVAVQGLADHEEEHVTIVREGVADIQKSINGTTETATAKTPAEALKKATEKAVTSARTKFDNGIAEVHKKSDKLDADTDFGRKKKDDKDKP